MDLTESQKTAVVARGNVLVVAGAGTGKTSTLVERCLACLLDEKNPASLDEILMVTFTEAAATEMRQRIRARIEKEFAENKNSRWQEDLALFDTAHIGTLHSFCLQLVRQHFYELELDPQLAVLAEEEAKLMANENLDKIFEDHYANKSALSGPVQELIQKQGRGLDKPIRALVLKLHHYTQTLRDPIGWFEAQLAACQSPEPTQWQAWLSQGMQDWRDRWLPVLQAQSSDNQTAGQCGAILQRLAPKQSVEEFSTAIQQCFETLAAIPRGKKGAWAGPLKSFFDEAKFLRSVSPRKGTEDPLAQDWNWVRPHLATLLQLAREFNAKFSEAKKESGAVDFHDLEQHALALLWDRKTGAPTKIARHWREKLRFVFVDEYQDINEAQDAILKAVSREDDTANRFLVGDVKQSIYRFRLADPHIFQDYVDTWKGKTGNAIPLLDNFRSREGILSFVNSLFAPLMRREIGGVEFGEDAKLVFGDPKNRRDLAGNGNSCVELHLRLKGGDDASAPADGEPASAQAWAEMMNLEDAARDARMAALRLRELKTGNHQVWDNALKSFRPVDWGDMAVLLRSPYGKADTYAREFTRLGIPLTIARNGFYESMEIMDLLSLLRLLDNPLQDVPALAVLHSPLVGMTLDELASVRLAFPRGHCWTALQRFHKSQKEQAGWIKADRFLQRFAEWRRLIRQISLSRCIQAVLDETHYSEWLLTQPRGEQRRANVQRFVALARQFDQFQRQGLSRFLRFIEAQQDAETEPQVAAISGEETVRLMSIHQSKGLEFPVVVAADLGKGFNLQDLRAELILDAEYGLCPLVKPPHTGQRYPSLPLWLARRRQKQETLGEEMRLLYVALTRARDTLILTGSVASGRFLNDWREPAGLNTQSVLASRSCLDWIAAWCLHTTGESFSAPNGENAFLRWIIYEDLDERLLDNKKGAEQEITSDVSADSLDEQSWRKLHDRLTWRYPHGRATEEPAKTTVTMVRKRLAEDDEAVPKFKIAKLKFQSAKQTRSGKLSASEVGTAHHLFLQRVSLDHVGSMAGLQAEAQRLQLEETLSAEQVAALDFKALSNFWQSSLGKEIREQAKFVRRELEFTTRFSPAELELSADANAGLVGDEFVVVQGVADLTVFLPNEIWLVDFKTDQIDSAELSDKRKTYEPQVKLYAKALKQIYDRRVSRMYLHFLALGESVQVS